MSNKDIEDRKYLQNLQPYDIQKIVQNHGRANCGGRECTLKHPKYNDPQLLEMIKDPLLKVKAIGTSSPSGEISLELKAGGKKIQITVF